MKRRLDELAVQRVKDRVDRFVEKPSKNMVKALIADECEYQAAVVKVVLEFLE